jgi:hypothetical protein
MLRDSDDFAVLGDLVRSRETLCYRDGRGRKMFGVIKQMPSTDERYGYSVEIEFTEIDYTEVV